MKGLKKTAVTYVCKKSVACTILMLIVIMSSNISFAGDFVDINKLWPENRKAYSKPSPCEKGAFEIMGPGEVKLTLDVNPYIRDLYQYGHQGGYYYWNVAYPSDEAPLGRAVKKVIRQDGRVLENEYKAVDGRPLTMESYYRLEAPKAYKGAIFLCPPFKTSNSGDFEYQWRQSARLTLKKVSSGGEQQQGGGLNVEGTWNTTEFGVMVLKKQGSLVTGSYTYKNGTVNGTLRGSVLEGYWIQTDGRRRCPQPKNGSFYWGKISFNFQGNKFAGTWGYCEEQPHYRWDGEKR